MADLRLLPGEFEGDSPLRARENSDTWAAPREPEGLLGRGKARAKLSLDPLFGRNRAAAWSLAWLDCERCTRDASLVRPSPRGLLACAWDSEGLPGLEGWPRAPCPVPGEEWAEVERDPPPRP